MKTSKVLLTLFLAITLIACKKEDAKVNEVEENAPAIVTFTLNAVVQQNDDFQLFYKEDNNMESPFDEVTSIWVGANGTTAAQDIVMTLPEDAFPTSIRLDFGHNNKQSDITVNSFKMTYKGKTFEVKGADFFNYFIPDPVFVKVDPATAKVTPVLTKDGLYDPLFISNEKFNNEMAKLLK